VAAEWSGAGDPPLVDVTVPTIARVYDVLLGGKQNFAADRAAAAVVLQTLPEAARLARENRDLVRRVVRHLVTEAGIGQFVDLGSGLPTGTGNVHDVAHGFDPTARVLYVDRDPMVLTHARAMLGHGPTIAVLDADARDPAAILDHPVTKEFLDPDRPVAVLAAGLLQHFTDAEARSAAATVVDRLRPGGYFMMSNYLDDDEPRAVEIEQAMERLGIGPFRFRTWTEQQRLLEGLDLVAPGLDYANDWRPDEHTATDSPVHTLCAGAVGRRR
jgi:SAM-dependent methyltransferase